MLPDWQILLGELTAVQVVLWLVAAGLLIALVIKLWPFVSNAVAIVNALIALPKLVTDFGTVKTDINDLKLKVEEIHHETHRNDGSSIKDAVGRIEEGVKALYDRTDEMRDVDDELRHALEDTHPPQPKGE